MLQFTSDITLDQQVVRLLAEELDTKPDKDDYIHFSISVDERMSIIHIHMDYFRPPAFYTPEDAEDYFEKINYPEQPPCFSNDQVFTAKELWVISKAIALYVLKEQTKSMLK